MSKKLRGPVSLARLVTERGLNLLNDTHKKKRKASNYRSQMFIAS